MTTQAKFYDVPESFSSSKDSITPPTSTVRIMLDKPMERFYHPPQGVVRKATHNPSALVAQHYSIFEDLAQAPCAMFSLEVLQIFPQ